MKIKQIDWPSVLKTVLLHLIFWIIVLLYFAWAMGFDRGPKRVILHSMIYIPGHMILVYPLLYYLTTKFLLKGKYLYFFLGIIVLIIICQFYSVFYSSSVNTKDGIFAGMFLNTGRNVLPYLHIGGIALTIKLLKRWYQQKELTSKIEQQKMNAELKLIKAQLNPHFLFNTLNNLHSHTLEKSKKAPEIVLKLSTMLRFMIYESNSKRIPLSKEIELLKNYIALEQLRFGDRLDISTTFLGDFKSFQIAPLLLLPFLENAFKHGTSNQIDQCWIRLDLSVDDAMMHFKLVNGIDPISSKKSGASEGIGLQNVKRRLELNYPDNYSFEAILQDEVFIVNLSIQLEELQEEFVEKLALT